MSDSHSPADPGAADDAIPAVDASVAAAEADPRSITNLASGVYGTIVAASVLAAGANETLRSIIALVIVTLVVYWLAEQYAHALAHSLAGHRAHRSEVARGLREGWPMVEASYLPVGVLLVCYLLGVDTNVAVDLALAACVLVLFVLGWLGGARRGLLLRGRIYSALIAGSFGMAVVVLKLIVTH